MFFADALLLDGRLETGWALDLDANGFIRNILRVEDCPTPPTHLPGVLCPGLVNAHCHLELSHLAGKYPGGEGMAGFVHRVISGRNGGTTPAQRQDAAREAISTANALGTVAFGDIANTADSLHAKREWASRVYTHTFIEVFGRDGGPSALATHQAQAQKVMAAFQDNQLAHSIVAHAPYTMSAELFQWIHRVARSAVTTAPLSFHLLESEDEVRFFTECGGPMWDLLAQYGGPMPGGGYPTAGVLAAGRVPNPYLFVHLTHATADDLRTLAQHFDAYFVLCPRSNVFLHSRLPDAALFPWSGERVSLGTDSLSSCPSLDLIQEAVALQAAYPQLDTPTLLRAATHNGALALGINDKAGQFRVGTAPGVVQVTGLGAGYAFTPNTVARLVMPACFDSEGETKHI